VIHIYTGAGKGKTTAALGLALRSAGRGRRVVIVQFLKGRETGELSSLALIPNITIFRNSKNYGFFSEASEDTRREIVAENNANLQAALNASWDLLILDEACSAYTLGALDRDVIDALIESCALKKDSIPEIELVLTGRDPPEHFQAAADYISSIQKVKHPYDRGIGAREGIEY
jgi:cob(I)alamin adenosyltransferase